VDILRGGSFSIKNDEAYRRREPDDDKSLLASERPPRPRVPSVSKLQWEFSGLV
jgi:hypothetical protein